MGDHNHYILAMTQPSKIKRVKSFSRQTKNIKIYFFASSIEIGLYVYYHFLVKQYLKRRGGLGDTFYVA